MRSLDKAVLKLDRPIGEAQGLANRFYRDPELLNFEKTALFKRNWIALAVDSDIANPGDAKPCTLAGQPLLLLRDQAGIARAFYNVCRHRGAKLLDRPCEGLRTISCPYHAWTYGLDGGLRATPRFDGTDDNTQCAFDAETSGLLPVRLAQWNHILFVDLSGQAPPLEDWLSPLITRWSDYDLTATTLGGEAHYDIAANWKLVLENFLESYHLPFVHQALNSYSPLGDHEQAVTDLYMGQISHHYVPVDDASGQLPVFQGLPRDRRDRAEYFLVFPNLMLSVAPDHFRITLVTPEAVDRTNQRWLFYFNCSDETDNQITKARQALVDRICAVTDEDIPILERLQAGRSCDAYDGGRFSPYHERTVHRFQTLVARALAGGSEA